MTTNMLVDQHNANVFPLGRESLKCLLDGRGIRLGVDNEEVLLRVWRGRDMLPSGISHDRAHGEASKLTPIPARSRPVTESCCRCGQRGT